MSIIMRLTENDYDDEYPVPIAAHYIRIKRPYVNSVEDKRHHRSQDLSMIEISKLLGEGVPIQCQIQVIEDNRNAHNYFGQFISIGGITLYKNMIVTLGVMKFKDYKYKGLEFLANTNIDVKSGAEEFIKEVSAKIGYKGKNLYQVSPVLKLNNF